MAFALTIPKWYNTWVLQIFFVNIWTKIFFKIFFFNFLKKYFQKIFSIPKCYIISESWDQMPSRGFDKNCVSRSLSNMSKNGLRMVVCLNFDITHLSPPTTLNEINKGVIYCLLENLHSFFHSWFFSAITEKSSYSWSWLAWRAFVHCHRSCELVAASAHGSCVVVVVC